MNTGRVWAVAAGVSAWIALFAAFAAIGILVGGDAGNFIGAIGGSAGVLVGVSVHDYVLLGGAA